MSENNVDEKLQKHNAALAAHKERLEQHKLWLTRQREQPFREDILLDAGRRYNENKDKLREKILEEENKEITHHPEITALAKKLQREGKFEDRFMQFEKMRQQNIENIKKKKEEEEMKELAALASQRSKTLDGERRKNIVEINQAWATERESRLEMKRRQKESEDLKEVQPAPQLNSKTLKIINKMKDRDRPIEEYLAYKERKRQQSLEQKYHESFPEPVPRITPQAASLVREGSITDRLYEMSFQHHERRMSYLERGRMAEEQHFDFVPSINDSSHYYSRLLPVEDDLLRRDEEAKQRRLEKLERLLEKEREMHNPRINPVSEEIAARLPNTSKDRLLNNASMRSSRTQSQDSVEYTFKPELCAKSLQIEQEKNAPNSTARINQMLHKEKKKQMALKVLKSYYEQQELAECTFTPRTIAKKELNQSTSFNERLQQWQKRKEEKVERERNTLDKKEMEECTFRPNIERTADGIGNISYYDDTALLSTSQQQQKCLGFDEYVQRQILARAMREEGKKGPFITGENWKNELTRPKEFKLGRHRSVNIKALEKPLSPPSRTSRRPDALEASFDSDQSANDSTESFLQQYASDSMQKHDDQFQHQSSEGNDLGSGEFIDSTVHVDIQPGVFSAKSTMSILASLNALYGNSGDNHNDLQDYEEQDEGQDQPTNDPQQRDDNQGFDEDADGEQQPQQENDPSMWGTNGNTGVNITLPSNSSPTSEWIRRSREKKNIDLQQRFEPMRPWRDTPVL